MAKKLELGLEPKRMTFLALTLALAGYLFYTNVFSTPEAPERPAPPKTATKAKAALNQAVNSLSSAAPETGPRKASSKRGGRSEFKPSLKMDAEGMDPSKIDPTLRLDLLTKLAAVRVEKVDRSLFDFAAGPPKPEEAEKPKQPEPKIVPTMITRMIGPEPEPPPPPPPVKPPPPPISLKFYGSSVPVKGGAKRVFLMDGDQVSTPAEGDVFKNRYKIVKINAGSVVVEDLEYKNQQTLPIEEIPANG